MKYSGIGRGGERGEQLIASLIMMKIVLSYSGGSVMDTSKYRRYLKIENFAAELCANASTLCWAVRRIMC